MAQTFGYFNFGERKLKQYNTMRKSHQGNVPNWNKCCSKNIQKFNINN